MRFTCSAFLCGILLIVGICSEKQMYGVATGSHVAFMANKQSVRDNAVFEGVRNAVRSYVLVIEVKRAVTGSEFAAAPHPAFIVAGKFNLRPKLYNLFGGKLKKHGNQPFPVPYPRTVSAVAGFNSSSNLYSSSVYLIPSMEAKNV
jgi:hypothetical protein